MAVNSIPTRKSVKALGKTGNLRGVAGDVIRLQATDHGNPSFGEGVTMQLFRPDGTLMMSASNHIAAVIRIAPAGFPAPMPGNPRARRTFAD